MSYKLADAVFKIRLTATEKAVLGALCSHANDRSPTVWVSVATLVLESGASRRTVQRTLRDFEQRGFIRALFGKKGGKHSETVNYKILIPNADIVAAIQSEYNDGDGPKKS
jgi:DNA-binding IscR family transcriptional regulator